MLVRINGSLTFQNVIHAEAPSTRAASWTEAGMDCNPARSSSATNGVVFQTSRRIAAAIASTGVPSQSTPGSSLPNGPDSGLNKCAQIFAEITVGIAHGTSTAARRMLG